MSDVFDNNFLETNLIQKYNIKKLFDEKVFNKNYYSYYFDDTTTHVNYGLRNSKNNLIHPSSTFLTIYKNNNNQTHTNIFFVVDAFNDLKKYYLDLRVRSVIQESNIFNNLNVKESTVDANIIYKKYIDNLYNVFTKTFLKEEIIKNIKNLNDFIKYFAKFVKITTKILKLNRHSYFASNQIPNNINGLVITLDGIQTFSIKNQTNKIINDPGFDFFVKNAARFGFFIDKNAPWKIVADLNSAAMKKYMKNYGVYSAEYVFNNFYYRTEDLDLDYLKITIIDYWNKFVSENPLAVEHQEQICNRMFVSIQNRQNINEQLFDAYFDNSFLLRMYCYTRILEEKIDISQVRFESIVKESVNINNLFSKQEAIYFINNRIKEIKDFQQQQDVKLTTDEEMLKMLESYKLNTSLEGINF